MKLSLVMAMLVLSGCAQLMKGGTQPVVTLKNGDKFTSCSGAVEDWGSCNSKARQTCSGGFDIINKEESPVGGKRELTFTCK